MLAQRYPDAYDGIAAAAPALNWAQFFPAATWAQVMMSITGQYPSKCEIDALTDAAVAACDPLDGVIDGIISDVSRCSFDPFALIGSTAYCRSTNTTITISEAAVSIANLTWTGPRKSNGDFLWHGVNYQARLTGSGASVNTTSDIGYAGTSCNANGTCTGVPTGLGDAWLKYFVKKDPGWDYTKIKSVDEYARLFHAGVQEYESIIGTSDPDLSAFRDTGGKILTYHGLVSTFVPSQFIIVVTDICTRPTDSSLPKALKTITTASRIQFQTSTTSSAISKCQVWLTVPEVAAASLRPHSKHLLTGLRKALRQRHCRSNSRTRTTRNINAYYARTLRERS